MKTTSKHESVPYCDGSGREACVACSEAVDRCVPFPCDLTCGFCLEPWSTHSEPEKISCERDLEYEQR